MSKLPRAAIEEKGWAVLFFFFFAQFILSSAQSSSFCQILKFLSEKNVRKKGSR